MSNGNFREFMNLDPAANNLGILCGHPTHTAQTSVKSIFLCEKCIAEIKFCGEKFVDEYSLTAFDDEPLLWLTCAVSTTDFDIDFYETLDRDSNIRGAFHFAYVASMLDWADQTKSAIDWNSVMHRTQQMSSHWRHDEDSDIQDDAFRIAIRLLINENKIAENPQIANLIFKLENDFNFEEFNDYLGEMRSRVDYEENAMKLLFQDYGEMLLIEEPNIEIVRQYFYNLIQKFPTDSDLIKISEEFRIF